jgi:hypothetical protein
LELESAKKIINFIFGGGIMGFLKKIFIIILVLLTLNLYLPRIHFAQELQLYSKSETVRSPEIRSAPKPEIRSTPEKDIPKKKSRWLWWLIGLALVGGGAAAISGGGDEGSSDSGGGSGDTGSGTITW